MSERDEMQKITRGIIATVIVAFALFCALVGVVMWLIFG